MITYPQLIADMKKLMLSYIISVLEKRGSDYQLVDPNSYEAGSEYEDDVFELPRIWSVDDNDEYHEYPCVILDYEDGKVIFRCIPLDSSEDYDKDFLIDEVSVETLAVIAELVYKLEN